MNEYLLTAIITFLAFYLNGITGFGSNLIFIPLAALILGPKESVILCGALNPIAEIMLVKIDTKAVSKKYWLPIASTMAVGSVLGAFFLKLLPTDIFGWILAILTLILGLWFLSGRRGIKNKQLTEKIPKSSTLLDHIVCLTSGISGGALGINGPPLILYFGCKLKKDALRKILVLLFFPASILLFATYVALDLMSNKLWLLLLICIPSLFLGTWLGNKAFQRISLKWFNVIIGASLVLVALKIM